MTVPGVAEKSDDKEKLVTEADVATILPKRDRLIKIKKRRHILRVIISLALLLLFLSTIFLTICYVKKIGPFHRHLRGRIPISSDRYRSGARVYESFEVTDEYALITVPRVSIRWGSFRGSKALHVYDKRITVIQYEGVCFVRPMLGSQHIGRDWVDRVGHFGDSHHQHPNFMGRTGHGPGAHQQFNHVHWRLTSRRYSPHFLRDRVHHLAAAMCMSRPVFNLRRFSIKQTLPTHPPAPIQPRHIPIVNNYKNEIPILKSSTRVDPNCKTIRCENKCQKEKVLGCVQCRCADKDIQTESKPQFQMSNGMKMNPLIVEENKATLSNELPSLGDIIKPLQGTNSDKSAGDSTTGLPVFQDLSRIHRNDNKAGLNREKRSVGNDCKVIAEIFEGINPLDGDSKPSVDFIHNC